MKYIDLHCDTILPILYKDDGLRDNKNISVDIVGLKESEALAQCFAIWMPDEEELNNLEISKDFILNGENSDLIYINRAFNKLNNEIEKNYDLIAWAKNGKEIEKNEKNNLISAILTMEDGRAIDNNLENLEYFYKLGVRILGLTWNYENCLGYPKSDNRELMNKGLKKFGIETIEYMNYLNIIVDVSHLSDGGFYDVIKYSKKPFIATHSNCRSLVNNPRNLTDDMIKSIGNAGGIIGVNFAPEFLDASEKPIASIEYIVKHLNHMKNIGGKDIIALGSDFDGVWGDMEIKSSKEMQKLFEALEEDGWQYSDMEKFAYKNALRILNDI